ncbi:hypothetical protein ACFX2J_015776 [Malus domestica]
MTQVSKICSNEAQSINLFPNVSKPQIPKSSNLKSHFLGSSNSLSLKLKYGFAGSFTVGKFRVDPLRIAASVATAEKPLTVLEIVLQPIEEISGTIKLPGSNSGDLVDGLKQLGADADFFFLGTNCPPVRVIGKGGLPGGKVKLSGSISSQYLTGDRRKLLHAVRG